MTTATPKNLNELSVGDAVLIHRDWQRNGWVKATVERVTRTQVTVDGSVFRIDANRPHFATRRGDKIYASSVQTFDQSVLDKQESAIKLAADRKARYEEHLVLMNRISTTAQKLLARDSDAVIDRLRSFAADLEGRLV